MAIKKAIYKVDNGSDFDEIMFKTLAEMVSLANGQNLENEFMKVLSKLKNVEDGPYWGISHDSNGVYIENKLAYKKLYIENNGSISYMGSKVVMSNSPKVDTTVKVPPNSSIDVAHNLGYEPLIEVSNITLGNVNVTWKHKNVNVITIHNYQGTSNNEAYVRVRGW